MADDNGDHINGNSSLSLEMIDVSPTTECEVHNEEKVLKPLVDESKVARNTSDGVAAENILPLFPQWLYAKPSETKTGISTAPGGSPVTHSLSHSNSTDAMHNEGCHIDENHDKKEQRVGLETETSCRWREEERDTGLHGRRDHKEYDGRAGNTSNKETADGRWIKDGNCTGGLETLRGGKWTSRWDPENKENYSQTGNKICTEKGDSVSDKQSFAANARDNDSCAKWRPRHRVESQSSRSSNRTVQGNDTGGRFVGSSTVRYSLGRGRSITSGSSPLGRPSLTHVTGPPVDKSTHIYEKTNLSSDTFRYPRGKLLDIYRKQRLVPSFDDMPKGMENAMAVAQSTSNEPLAFIAPNAEEEAILSDIMNGKFTHVDGISNSSRAVRRSTENVKGARHLKGALPIAEPGELGQSEEVTLVNHPKFSDAGAVAPVVVRTELSNAPGSLFDALTFKTVPLNTMAGSSANASFITSLEHSDAVVGSSVIGTSLTPGLPGSAVILEHQLANDNVESPKVHHDHSGTSEKLVPTSHGQPKIDSTDPVKKPSDNLYDTWTSSLSSPSLATGPAEPSMLNPKDSNMDSFGFLGSGPKGIQSNYSPSLNRPSGNGQTFLMNSSVLREAHLANREENSIAGCTSFTPFVEAWYDTDRSETKFDCDLRNSIEGHQFPSIQQGRFMDQYLEQFRPVESGNEQLNNQNQSYPRPALHTDLPIAQSAGLFMSRKSAYHQQPIGQSIPDLENVLAIQAERQSQFHFQLHQLQERKVLCLQLEQIHLQRHYPGLSNSEFDHQNVKNKIQLAHKQNFGHNGQHHLHSSSSHSGPLLEQFSEAKFGEDMQRDYQDYLHGEMQSGLGFDLQQDQLQANLLMKLHATEHSVSVKETREFDRGSINALPVHPEGVGHGPFNYYQQQLRPFLYEQLSSEKNLAIQEQQLRGVYGPNSTLFERPMALSAGHEMDLELDSAQNIDMQRNHTNSVCQMDLMTSNFHPLQPWVARKFHTSNIDTYESQSNGLPKNSMDSFMQVQFERDKLEPEMLSKGPSLWCTTHTSDESSMPILADPFQEQLNLPNAQSFEVAGSAPPSFSDRRDSSGFISESSFANYSKYDLQSGESSSFPEGIQYYLPGKSLQGLNADVSKNDQSSCSESSDRMSISLSEKLSKKQFSLGMKRTSQALYVDSSMVGLSLHTETKAGSQMTGDYRSRSSKINEIQDIIAEQLGINDKYTREVPSGVAFKEDSTGTTDETSKLCSFDMGINTYSEDAVKQISQGSIWSGLSN